MKLRAFADGPDGFAKQWRNGLLTDLKWTETGPPGERGGEAQGFTVTSGSISGYAKPGFNNPPVATLPRAAFEKIAADLAFDLGLPVPPVLLWDRGSVAPPAERFACISAIPFEPLFRWDQVQAAPSLAQRLEAGLSGVVGAMSAFDTWVGNRDRPNGGNLVVGEDTSTSPPTLRAAYIDYSLSLGYGWAGDTWNQDTPIGCFPNMSGFDVAVMATVVDEIEGLDDARIEEVVRRVPEEFLPRHLMDLSIRGLLGRKPMLRAILKAAHSVLL